MRMRWNASVSECTGRWEQKQTVRCVEGGRTQGQARGGLFASRSESGSCEKGIWESKRGGGERSVRDLGPREPSGGPGDTSEGTYAGVCVSELCAAADASVCVRAESWGTSRKGRCGQRSS